MKIICHVTPEGIISVRPEADIFAIDIYLRFAHCAIKQDYMPPSLQIFRIYLQTVSVRTLSHIREAACSSCLFCSDILSVLCHCDCLKIVCLVERTIYGPVMRDRYILPPVSSRDVMPFAEFPFLKHVFSAQGL